MNRCWESRLWTVWLDVFELKSVKLPVKFPRSFMALASRKEEGTMKLPSCIFDSGRIPKFTSSSPLITLHGQFNIKELSYEIHVRGVRPQREHKFNKPTPPNRHLNVSHIQIWQKSQNSDPNTATAWNIRGIWRLFLVHFTALSGE